MHTDGVGTTLAARRRSTRAAPLDPRLAELVQSERRPRLPRVHGKVAAARKTTPDKIDAVARGRVWSGAQAKERGLVDTLGMFGDALASAAKRANLGEKPRVVYIEREPGRFAQLLSMLNTQVSAWVGAEIDSRIGGTLAVAPALVRGATRISAGSATSSSAGSRSRRSPIACAAKRT